MRSIIFRTGVLSSSIIVMVACGGTKGWDTKATLNERGASGLVGGFSSDDSRLYHLGVQHVLNRHQPVGSLTIGQVIDQERGRESQRSDFVQKARTAQEDRTKKQRDVLAEAPKVSAYAHSISLLLQLDYAAALEIKNQASNDSMSGVYAAAEQTVEGISDAQSGLSEKKPDGFDRTQDAADAYMRDMKSRYQSAADLANEPTPKNQYAFRKANQYEYAGAVLKAFDDDLADAQYPSALRTKLRARIRGN